MAASDFNPVFLGGAGRSGTTLLRTMLASHPALAGTNEFKLLPNIADARRMFDGFDDVMSEYHLSNSDIDEAFAGLVERLFMPYLQSEGGKRLVEKTPHNVMAIDVLTHLFPQAKIVHIIRDGRDVACSLLGMEWYGPDGQKLWYTSSVEAAATYWKQVVESALYQAEQPAAKSQCRRLHYEALISDPHKHMQQLLEWLGEEWDDAVLDTARRQGMVESELKESSTDQVAQAINSKAIGRWRKTFSQADRQTFHAVAGDLLIKLGYTKDGSWVNV